MPSVAVIVWSWHHEGRHEALFLELGDSYRIHFLRRTRSRRLAWGSCGTWALLMDCITIRLQLRNFRCCEGARIRQVEFQVDPVDPRFMVDGTGRRIRYLGVMHMSIFQHDPRRALSLTGDVGPEGDWVVLVGSGLGLELRMRFVSRPCSGKEER